MIAVGYHLARQLWLTQQVLRKQWMSLEALRQQQLHQLQAMVAHAYHNVPLQRQRFDAAGLRPADFRSLEDLQRLPPVAKPDMRTPAARAQGYDERNSVKDFTSGSSGARLELYHDRDSHDLYTALSYRQYAEMGYRPWHRRAYFRWEPFQTPLVLERFGLLRRFYVPINGSIEEQVAALRQAQPDLICGYPSSLLVLARGAEPAALRSIGAKMIELNSESFLPEELALIEERFGCPAYNEYSSFELYQMAFECRVRRLHVVAENVILEVLDSADQPAAPGVLGEVVVTGLTNKAMPFLRYRTGDLAMLSAERCPCGRAHPVIASVEGRRDDQVIAGGRTHLAIPLIGSMLRCSDVIEYQIHQVGRGALELKVVPRVDHAAQPQLAERLRQQLQDAWPVDEPLSVQVNFVERIPRGLTGKRKAFVIDPALREALLQQSVAIQAG